MCEVVLMMRSVAILPEQQLASKEEGCLALSIACFLETKDEDKLVSRLNGGRMDQFAQDN